MWTPDRENSWLVQGLGPSAKAMNVSAVRWCLHMTSGESAGAPIGQAI